MMGNISNEWKNYCNVDGIIHKFSVPHNPQQNRVVDIEGTELYYMHIEAGCDLLNSRIIFDKR